MLFENSESYEIPSCEYRSDDHVNWSESNVNVKKRTRPEEHHYEVLSGSGKITGKLLGGCIDVFPMIVGTEIWPERDKWKDKIPILKEFNCESLPVIYNVNIGHAMPNGLLPLGIKYEIDLDKKRISLLESAAE